ncbi:MAG: type IV pilus twitching motility protein PilT [Erysipelotrichaceae bacterium]
MNIFQTARAMQASDIHLTNNLPVIFRVDGQLITADAKILTSGYIYQQIEAVLTPKELRRYDAGEDIDTAINVEGQRYRLNAFRQKEHYALSIRVLNDIIPTIAELGLPPVLKTLCMKKRGLVLVVGPTGSGKSTTLASMINYINEQKRCHILTLEDPIEYIHNHKKSMINQREIGTDVESFERGLRSALREDPDVILVGELRDFESISLAISAAETGHLVFATLHTSGAPDTIDRIIDVFPAGQQNQIRMQLSTTLLAVVSQALLPLRNETGRIACVEVMLKSDAISNLIRENKTYQILSTMQTGLKDGMIPFDTQLLSLYQAGKISHETLMESAHDLQSVQKISKGLNYDVSY